MKETSGSWLQGVVSSVAGWMLGPLVVVCGLAVGFLAVRWLVERRVRGGVRSFAMVPSSSHAEGYESVRQRSANLATGVHRAGFVPFTGAVDGYRIVLRPDARGRLVAVLSVPGHAVQAARTAIGSLKGVSLRVLAGVALPPNPLAAPPDYRAPDDAAASAADAEGQADANDSQVVDLPQEDDRVVSSAVVVATEGGDGDGAVLVPTEVLDADGAGALDDGADVVDEDPPAAASEGDSSGEASAGEGESVGPRRFYTARQLLTVTGPKIGTLTVEGNLSPNLQGAIAEVYRHLDVRYGNDAAMVVDVLPLGAWARARHVAELSRELDKSAQLVRSGKGGRLLAELGGALSGGQGRSITDEVAAALSPRSPRVASGPARGQSGSVSVSAQSISAADRLMAERHEARRHMAKSQPLMRVRITLVARNTSKKAARGTVEALRDALSPLDGTTRFRASGLSVGFGSWRFAFLGANMPGRAAMVDRSLRLFKMPVGERPVTAAELAPLLGPPTKEAVSDNVRRYAPLSAPPREMPVYDRDDPTVLPLGDMTDAEGVDFRAAVNVKDYKMAAKFAGSGNGKTETEITTSIHIARTTDSGMTWFDPEGRVFSRMAQFIADTDRRVNVIDLRSGKQPGWNPLDMTGKMPQEADDIVNAMVGAIQNALHWDDRSNRALTILTMSFRSLLRINTILVERGKPELQATLFTLPFLLNNEEFRNRVCLFLPSDVQAYWEGDFGKLDAGSVPVVTNLMNRLRGDYSPLGAFLGSPVSTYRVRETLENGDLTFICPTTGSDKDKLVANLLLFFFILESRRREDEQTSKLHYLFLDEMPVYDSKDGQIAKIYEMLRKRNIVATGLGQTPARLSAATRLGMFVNLSCLSAGPAEEADAAMLSSLTHAPGVEVFGDLELHQWVGRFRVGKIKYGPCLFTGIQPEDVWADKARPDDVPALMERVDADSNRRTRAEVSVDLNGADAKLAAYLDQLLRGAATAAAGRRAHSFDRQGES